MPPPLARPWKFFTGDFIWKGAFFAIFQQELQNSTMFDGLLRFQISEKWANLTFPLNIQKQKVFQLQGRFAPWPPDQGLCPWTPLGARSPDPRYRLALHALAMVPPLPNPKYATACIAYLPLLTRCLLYDRVYIAYCLCVIQSKNGCEISFSSCKL